MGDCVNFAAVCEQEAQQPRDTFYGIGKHPKESSQGLTNGPKELFKNLKILEG
jgi:hypothetical protein